MEALSIAISSVTCFVIGFWASAYVCFLSNKEKSITSEEFEKSIRNKISSEISMHANFEIGVPVDKEKLKNMSPEVVGFNLGLHTASLIIKSAPGDKLIIVEMMDDDGEVIYDVEKM